MAAHNDQPIEERFVAAFRGKSVLVAEALRMESVHQHLDDEVPARKKSRPIAGMGPRFSQAQRWQMAPSAYS